MLIGMGLQKQVWVFMQATDMRKQFDALYGLVKSFHSVPLNGDIFLLESAKFSKSKTNIVRYDFFYC